MSLPRITSVRAILRYPASLNSGSGVSATQSSGSVTFSLNIPGLTTDAAPTSDDFLITYDQAAGAPRKATIGSIITSTSINFIASRSYSVDHTITTDDAGRAIFLTGTAMGTLTFGAIGNYSATHANSIYNTSSRRWSVVVTGGTTKWLWPQQKMDVASISGSAWGYSTPPLWKGILSAEQVPTGIEMYCDPNLGNDANDGLTTGAGGAVFKIQAGINIAHYHFAVGARINLVAGTHTALTVNDDTITRLGPAHGHPSNIIYVTGDTSGSTTTRQTYIVQAPSGHLCVNCDRGGALVLQGIHLRSQVDTGTLVKAQEHAVVDLQDCSLGTATTHVDATMGGIVNFSTGAGTEYLILGGGGVSLTARRTGVIDLGTQKFRLPTALSFSTFAVASDCGVIWDGPATYTGTGSGAGSTGVKYAIASNAVISSGGTVFPGASAGTTATGGQYS